MKIELKISFHLTFFARKQQSLKESNQSDILIIVWHPPHTVIKNDSFMSLNISPCIKNKQTKKKNENEMILSIEAEENKVFVAIVRTCK